MRVRPGPGLGPGRSTVVVRPPTFTGVGELLRQALRRDRIVATASMAVFVLMAYASAFATHALYDSPAARERAELLINGQAGIRALYGPIDPAAGVGALAMSKMTVLYALFSCGLYVALVRRHTRLEEESGRAELLAGAAVGRNAPLAAAVLESAAVATLLGALCALATVVGGLPVRGSIFFGLSWVGTGLVATGLAAICCQLSSSARTCAIAAAASLGVLFSVRAVGDATSLRSLDWLSPLGWNTQLHAWSEPRAWVLGLYGGTALGLVAVAQWLRAHRDLGGGVIGARAGAPRGSRRLRGPTSLQLRLHRGMAGVWSVAILAVSVFFGAVTPALVGILKTVGGARLTAALGGSLIAAVLSEVAVMVSCFGVVIVVHSGADELQGRSELALSASPSRTRWYAATAGIAIAGAVWLLLLAGTGMWIGYGLAGGTHPAQALTGALAWIPVTMVVCALSAALWSLRPSATPWAWAWPLGLWALALVPPLLHAPGWVAALSPYDHVPRVPLDRGAWMTEGVMTLVTAALLAGAWQRFRTRDIG